MGSPLCPRNGQEASLTEEEGQGVSAGRDIREEMGSGSCRLCSHAGLWVLAVQQEATGSCGQRSDVFRFVY